MSQKKGNDPYFYIFSKFPKWPTDQFIKAKSIMAATSTPK